MEPIYRPRDRFVRDEGGDAIYSEQFWLLSKTGLRMCSVYFSAQIRQRVRFLVPGIVSALPAIKEANINLVSLRLS